MNPISLAIFVVFLAAAAVSFTVAREIPLAVAFVILGFVLAYSVQIAKQWQKAVVLRLGKLQAIRGPGPFMIIPIVDTIAAWIDHRIQTTEVNAEEALTKDTVPVNVDAIVFWQVRDTARAALEVTDYRQAIHRVSQTTLREMIGSSVLAELLSDRRAADARLKTDIAAKIGEWGIVVSSVEIRDVAIPAALQEAMSRQAQAERERQARVILGTAEEEIAQKFLNAAKLYEDNPVALQLRAMNIIYETTKERGATILLPTSLVDFMNPKGAKPG
jgi:regulator of protease activity HflC (stomatin/prohibitin superfamily)